MKFYGELEYGLETNWLHFGNDPDHRPDPGVRNPDLLDYRLCWRLAEVCALWALVVLLCLLALNKSNTTTGKFSSKKVNTTTINSLLLLIWIKCWLKYEQQSKPDTRQLPRVHHHNNRLHIIYITAIINFRCYKEHTCKLQLFIFL